MIKNGRDQGLMKSDKAAEGWISRKDQLFLKSVGECFMSACTSSDGLSVLRTNSESYIITPISVDNFEHKHTRVYTDK